MKKELTNVDVYVLVRELNYQRLEKMTRLHFGYKLKARPGNDLLFLGNMLIPTRYSVPSRTPDNLCKLFKKYLAGARVLSVEQLNFDRVLRIRTDRGNVVFELFGRGNIILTDANNRIIYAIEQREWSARRLLRGEEYVPPPPPKIHPSIGYEQFVGLFTSRDVVRSLVRAGLPPVYAEELCLRAGIDKNKPVDALEEKEKEALYETFRGLITSLDSPRPTAYFKDDEVVDVTPIPLTLYTDLEKKTFGSFSEALDILTPILLTLEQKEKKKDVRAYLLAEREKILEEMKELENMIEQAYMYAHELMNQMERARAGEKPTSVGPFTLKRWNKREIVYSFTPPA